MKKLLALLCSVSVALFAFSGCDLMNFFGADQFENPSHPAESSSQLPEESGDQEENEDSGNAPEDGDDPVTPPEGGDEGDEGKDPVTPPEGGDEGNEGGDEGGDDGNEGGDEGDEGDDPVTPEPVVISFNVGSATRVEFEAGGSASLEKYVSGKYKITWDESVTNLVVYYGMQPVTNGDIISVASPMVLTQISVSTADGAAFAGDILIEEYIPAPVTLSLGANEIYVEDGFSGVTVTFTAPDEGTLVFEAADGETNGDIGKSDETGTEWFGFPYSVSVEAGETVTLLITTADFSADTVSFNLRFEANYTPNY